MDDQPLTIVSFPVEGMTCASCVNRITRFLAAVPGVEEAQVSLATESATVRFDPRQSSLATLGAAVESAGYQAHTETVAAGDAIATTSDFAMRASADLRRRLVVAALFTAPLLLGLARTILLPGLPAILSEPWLMLALATPVQIYAGWPFYRGALAAARARSADMDTLVALGTSAAYFYSLAATVAPALFTTTGSPPLYFDTAAAILTLVTMGRFLEARARRRAGDAVRSLLDLAPPVARVRRDGQDVDIEAAQIRVGDLVIVRPGERLAVDGVVREGHSDLDESLLTGEAMPVPKAPGDEVTGGTLNGTGAVAYEATRVGAATTLARIVALVQAAQSSQAPIARLADRVTAVFVPVVLAIAGAAFGVWLLLGATLPFALTAAVTVLVVACPCALGLATPMSIVVGTGVGARSGILFRDAAALERLGQATTVVLDKTGTLTEGRPRLLALVRAPDAPDEDEILALAAAAERSSEHPLGNAIVEAAGGGALNIPMATDFAAIPGEGVRAQVGPWTVTVGTAALTSPGEELAAAAARLAAAGQSPVFVALDGRAVAVAGVADALKDGSPDAVAALHALGLEIVMATGDNEATATAIARQSGITTVMAGMRPADKATHVGTLRDAGRVVAMVGDGVNDAPALATADVGVAMGAGADIAISAAAVTLMRPDLAGLVTAVTLSRATMRNIRQNLAGAFVYNVLLIPLAAGVLYPFTGILLDPILAAAAMAASSVTVVSNALRLRGFRVA